jgi:hypothetical protein
MFISNI